MTEYLDVVDEEDKVIGKATRAECHATGKIHRGVHILVFNSKGELFVGIRSMNKDLYPGAYGDVAGHIDAGENYEGAAKREMQEEIGIECDLEKISDIKKRHGNDNENIRIYKCVHDGPINLNLDEFDRSEFLPVEKVKKMIDEGDSIFAPGLVLSLKEYLRRDR